MKTAIITLAMMIVTSLTICAQEREAPQLDLGDLGWTGTAFDSVTAFDARPYLWGWNWVSMDSNASRTLGMNVWHLRDPYGGGGIPESLAFGAQLTPGQLLIPTISGITGDVNNPSEAISMEWQPWLQEDGDTFALRPDDSTGGVFGFYGRHANGTVTRDNTDGGYRYRLETHDFTGETMVLWDVEAKDALKRVPPRLQDTVWRYNTDTLWLAVNLRRNDNSSDTGRLDEAVLRIRVPMWTRDTCSTHLADSTLARFRFIPSVMKPNETVNSTLNDYVGIRRDTVPTDLAPTEIVITRRMLPHLGAGEPDITIYGVLLFDRDPQRPPPPDQWHNPRFMEVWKNDPLSVVQRVSVNVVFTDELGVDIKSIRLESTQARELFWGQRDEQIRDAVRTHMDRAVAYNRDSVAVPGAQPRLWRFYGRDEIMKMHWKGFRYLNRLLHDRTATEWGVEEISKAIHSLRLKDYWASSFSPGLYRPVVRHGMRYYGDSLDSVRLYLGIGYGRDDRRDFETYLEDWRREVCPCDTATEDCDINDTTGREIPWRTTVNKNVYQAPLPVPAANYDLFVANGSMSGNLAAVERFMNNEVVNNPRLLFDTTLHVISNLWLFSNWTGNRDRTTQELWLSRGSGAKTLEELRLMQWYPIVLGSKGNLHFDGSTDQLPENALNNTGNPYWIPEQTSREVFIGAGNHINHVWNVATRGNARIDDDALGTDYLLSNDVSHYDLYVPQGMATTALALNSQQPNPPGIPLFRKTMRQAIGEVQHSIEPFSDSLMLMNLVAWRGQGFRHWLAGDTNVYTMWLWADSAHQQVFVTAEQDPASQMPKPRPEPYDSSFFDITVHSRDGAPGDNLCFIGVLNRRTDPRFDTVRWQDDVLTFDQLKARVRQNPSDLFRQYGSRRIRIPFHYSGQPGQALNLRVQELHRVDTTMISMQRSIDTVIGRDVPLDVDFLPGEGKIFRVSTVPASNSQNAGFLAHSNQRKIVAFPVLDTMVMVTDTVWGDPVRTYLRMVAGDTMRYHRVFHRRRDAVIPNPPNPLTVVPEGGPLAVWYQRSAPIVNTDTVPTGASQYAFDASTVTWEPPVNVSSRILWQPPGSDSALIGELSCGFPALVVRIDTLAGTRIAKVYIVFGCESETEQNPLVLVCESVIPADATSAEQQAFYNNDYSEVLDVTPAPLVYPVNQYNTLEHWGTPMINASASGNYYCWSHSINGIGAGFKEPHRRNFQAGQTEYLRLNDILQAAHPSLNSYSRLQIGEDDAGLVWQEGGVTYGDFILYTRLKHDGNNLIYHELTADPNPVVVGPDIISQDSTIAVLTDGNAYIDSAYAFVLHAFPVLYRGLSDWNITPENKFYELGLVNIKAERAYWQTLPWKSTNRAVIGRRVFDISDWTSSPYPDRDRIWSQSENFIFSDDYHLRGPDATQGEQWGEWGSDPEYASWDYDDSAYVLEFWSDTSELDPGPLLWHMAFGWDIYGRDVDYDHADLVEAGTLRLLTDLGRYPHLASRYSMTGPNNSGWQRNRRIFNSPGGMWYNYERAPQLWTSSQYFYKENKQFSTPQGLRYVGFRGPEGWGIVAPIHLKDQDTFIVFKPSEENAEGQTTSYATGWIGLPQVGDITVATKAIGKELVSELLIQRESDDEVFSMNAMAKNQDGETWRKDFTLLASKDERYRFLLERTKDRLWPAEDVEIRFPKLKAKAKEDQSNTIIDLRSMAEFTASENTRLTIYPNPASDMITIVINMGRSASSEGDADAGQLVLEISNNAGGIVSRTTVRGIDVIRTDVSTWPVGTYQAKAVNAAGIVGTQRFSVIR